MANQRIVSPDSPEIEDLCVRLSNLADEVDQPNYWPEQQLRLCGEAGVFEWFLPVEYGGQAWNDVDVVRGYLKLAASCLTTTFIITQRTGACRRVAAGDNSELKSRVLPALAAGDTFATVGISHLTTSHRHLGKPALEARKVDEGYLLNGFSPWVTSGNHANSILTGAQVMDGDTATDEQILAFVSTEDTGVKPLDPAHLVGLTASHTGKVDFDNVLVTNESLVAGPVENVMLSGRASTPGGHETSTLALGLAAASIDYLEQQASDRPDLMTPHEALGGEYFDILEDLLAVAAGESVCSKESLRQRANSLVLRSTQAALAAAKGAGYVQGHRVGRWCREALFFLVWSCPQPVMNANLCELAGLGTDN